MKIDVARLCLDCEELHDAQQCPSCGSEAFAFIKRWVRPSEEPARRVPRDTPPRAELYRRLLAEKPRGPRTGRLLTKGALGLAAVGLVGLIWQATRRRR